MPIPNLKYQVSGSGWAVSKPISMLIPAATIVDTSQPQWAALRGTAPIDAIALDQISYDWMTSTNGQIHGLGFDVNRVQCGPGVVSAALDRGDRDYWEKPQHREPRR
jgi:hypothetical protein